MPSKEHSYQPEDPRKVFVDKLEASRENPIKTALVIEEEMRVDLGTRLGFESPLREQPETNLSPDQEETVYFLGSWATFLCRRGILSPVQVGLWMEEPCEELDDKVPLDVVFHQLQTGVEEGEVFDNLALACAPFVRHIPQF